MQFLDGDLEDRLVAGQLGGPGVDGGSDLDVYLIPRLGAPQLLFESGA